MKANAGQMRKAKRGKRVGDKEGNEKGKQPGRRRPPLPFSPLSVCPPCLSSSRCTRCSERASGQLAQRALPLTGLLPMCEEKCIAGTGLDPYRGAKAMRAFLAFRSFVLLFTCGQCIAMNSCECSTTNTHSPSFRWGIRFLFERHHRSSMLKPLYTPTFGLLIVFTYNHQSPLSAVCSIVKSAS